MFFVLSKLLLIFLVPFWWIIILLVWMALSRSTITKKRLRIIVVILLVVFTNPFLYHSAVMAWQTPPVTIAPGKTYEAGIVLGGLSGYDKNGRGYFGASADRFIQVANLYHRQIIKKIIVSGGTGSLLQDGPAEAFFLHEQLKDNGIPDSAIILETSSRNTYENAVFTKKMIDSLRIRPPYLLVTSATHMPRSQKVFLKAGYDFISLPCDYKVVPDNFSLDGRLLPNISLLNGWAELIKEIVGLTAYRLTGKA